MYSIDHVKLREESILSYNHYQGAIVFGIDYFYLLRHTLGVFNSDRLISHIHSYLLLLKAELPYAKYLHDGQFIILIDKPLSPLKYQKICDYISSIFEQLLHFKGHDLYVTFSFGIALQDSTQSEMLTIVDRAYHALHQAKKRGQNQLVFYQDDLTENLIKKLSLKTQIYKGIKNKEFFLNYQPYFDIQTGNYKGVEALLRWQHPDYGVLAPKDFLVLAESTNLIVPLGKWIIDQSLQDLKKLHIQGYPFLKIAINISAKQLMAEDFIPSIFMNVEKYDLSFNDICLELTESELFEKSPVVIEKLNHLKQKGFSIAIDDFGVGFSNLNYLINLPIDKIKIDRSFLSLIDGNKAEILKAVFELADRLNIKTLIEGVETLEQLTYLKQTSCGEGQGFYTGKPMKQKDLFVFLDQKNVANIK